MEKVFILNLAMTGKNVFWKLLDGHPKIVTNHIHVELGTFFLTKIETLKKLERRKSEFSLIERARYNQLRIVFNKNKKQIYDVTFSELLKLMWVYGSYQNLHEQAVNKTIILNNKELSNEYFKFIFNIHKYESLIEKKLFNKKLLTLSFEEVLSTLHQIYSSCRKKRIRNPKIFIDCLLNGFFPNSENIWFFHKFKFICLTREPIQLCYSSLMRQIPNKDRSRKISYAQTLYRFFRLNNQYYYKIRPYYNFVNKNKNNPKIFFVDFNDLILNTNETMKNLTIFLKVNFHKILLTPSIDGQKMQIRSRNTLGKINDDPEDKFTKNDLKVIMKVYSRQPINSYILYKISVYTIFGFLILKSFFKKN